MDASTLSTFHPCNLPSMHRPIVHSIHLFIDLPSHLLPTYLCYYRSSHPSRRPSIKRVLSYLTMVLSIHLIYRSTHRSNFLSIKQSTCPSICQPIHPSVDISSHPSIFLLFPCPRTYLCIHLFLDASIYASTMPSAHLSSPLHHPSLHLPIHASIHASITPSIHPSIQLSVCPSIHASICLSVCPSVHLSIPPSIHRSVDPWIHRTIYPSIRLPLNPLPPEPHSVRPMLSFHCNI